jgi:hypothetical protein
VSVPAVRILEHCIPKPAPVLAPPQKAVPVKKVVRANAVAKRAVPKTVVKSKFLMLVMKMLKSFFFFLLFLNY